MIERLLGESFLSASPCFVVEMHSTVPSLVKSCVVVVVYKTLFEPNRLHLEARSQQTEKNALDLWCSVNVVFCQCQITLLAFPFRIYRLRM